MELTLLLVESKLGGNEISKLYSGDLYSGCMSHVICCV